MKYCSSCGHKLSSVGKFCGNCGASLGESLETPTRESPNPSDQPVVEESPSYGPEADAIVSFFGGFYFKAIVVVLSIVGITYALFNGGIPTPGVPSPAESYMQRKDWSPVPRAGTYTRPNTKRPRTSSPAQGRFDAYKRQRSGY